MNNRGFKYLKEYEDFKINEFVNIKKEDVEDKYLLNITSKDQLTSILNGYNIDLKQWGSAGHKTIDHLWNEITQGECVIYGYNGILKREVNFVGAKIIYMDVEDNNSRYILSEYKAVFKDGRVRKRNIWYSMAEKFKYGEDPREALIRGMQEELGIDISEDQCIYYNRIHFPEDSDYPGINSFHTGYSYLITLDKDQYSEDGYIEHQSDKDIYFIWKKKNKLDNISKKNIL